MRGEHLNHEAKPSGLSASVDHTIQMNFNNTIASVACTTFYTACTLYLWYNFPIQWLKITTVHRWWYWLYAVVISTKPTAWVYQSATQFHYIPCRAILILARVWVTLTTSWVLWATQNPTVHKDCREPFWKNCKWSRLALILGVEVLYSGKIFEGANFHGYAFRPSRRNFRGFYFRGVCL